MLLNTHVYVLLAVMTLAVLPAETTPRISGTGGIREGDAPCLVISGVAPGSEVELTATRRALYGRPGLIASRARFRADAQGQVFLHADAPLEGSWDSADPFALLWSMTPQDGSDGIELPEHVVLLRAVTGGATAEAVLDLRADQLEEIAVPEAGPGAFLLRPSAEGPHPAIIVLGGSEGGDVTARRIGPLLASRGFAVLGVPYYVPAWMDSGPGLAGLPNAFVNIPLERVETALRVLQARSDIRAGAIALYGVSKGAEMALAAASRIEGFAAIAAIVPSDVVWEGWGAREPGRTSGFSWRGEPLDFVPYAGMDEALARLARGEPAVLRVPHDEGRAANPERVSAARIDAAAIRPPVYLLGGGRGPSVGVRRHGKGNGRPACARGTGNRIAAV